MPDAWSPDEVRAMAAHPDELRRLGVVLMRVVDRILPRPIVPEKQRAHVKALCAAWMKDDGVGVATGTTSTPTESEASAHSGKEYPGELVEAVVRRASKVEAPGRTLRNRLHRELGASTYMVDAVFRLMRREPPSLADAGRGEGWLQVAGRVSATPRFINLHNLENGL
jgi:hypothetical protein